MCGEDWVEEWRDINDAEGDVIYTRWTVAAFSTGICVLYSF